MKITLRMSYVSVMILFCQIRVEIFLIIITLLEKKLNSSFFKIQNKHPVELVNQTAYAMISQYLLVYVVQIYCIKLKVETFVSYGDTSSNRISPRHLTPPNSSTPERYTLCRCRAPEAWVGHNASCHDITYLPFQVSQY